MNKIKEEAKRKYYQNPRNMNNNNKNAIIGILVIVIVFGLYCAFKRDNTPTRSDDYPYESTDGYPTESIF